MDKSLTIEQLKQDKQELERQILAVNGALMYVNQKIDLLGKLSEEEVKKDES